MNKQEKPDDLMELIDDLILQATKERSHFYVRSVLEQCKNEIARLEKKKEKHLSIMFQYRMLLRNKEEELTRIKEIIAEEKAKWSIDDCKDNPFATGVRAGVEAIEYRIDEENENIHNSRYTF